MSDGETDFAAFEAAANAGEPIPAAEVASDPAPKADTKADDPLDLTDADEAVEAADGDDGAEEHTDEEGRKRRSRPAHLRIAQEVAKRHDLQRELDALKAKYEPPAATAAATTQAPDRPNPEDFDYGEVDPLYIEALTDWKLDTREAERAKANEANSTRQQFIDRINTGVVGAETAGKAKYSDFEAKVQEAVEARGGAPLPPIITAGIGISPVGADLIYRLATDEAASAKLETLAAAGETNKTAMALGELEGEYLADSDDADLDVSDPLDMARMLGRMRARVKGVAGKPAPVVTSTNAPEPPEQRARGGSGRFQVDATTTDFAAFEKMANAKR